MFSTTRCRTGTDIKGAFLRCGYAHSHKTECSTRITKTFELALIHTAQGKPVIKFAFSINVWRGIINIRLTCPYILPEKLNGRIYVTCLRNVSHELLENVSYWRL